MPVVLVIFQILRGPLAQKVTLRDFFPLYTTEQQTMTPTEPLHKSDGCRRTAPIQTVTTSALVIECIGCTNYVALTGDGEGRD